MVKLLTGNALLGGEVVWWDGAGWNTDIAAAAPLSAEEGEPIRAREAAAERINDLQLIDAEESEGRYRPLKIRERIRGFGPTVRPDLVLSGRDYD